MFDYVNGSSESKGGRKCRTPLRSPTPTPLLKLMNYTVFKIIVLKPSFQIANILKKTTKIIFHNEYNSIVFVLTNQLYEFYHTINMTNFHIIPKA